MGFGEMGLNRGIRTNFVCMNHNENVTTWIPTLSCFVSLLEFAPLKLQSPIWAISKL